MKAHNYRLFDDDIENEAIDFIRESICDDIAFVGFSGGKDSIVTADLMRRSGVKYQLYYSFTGIDPPDVVRFIRRNYPECIFLRPTRTFWKNLSTNVPPGCIRWCCKALKKEPAWKLLHKKRIMGIRAEESTSRAKYGRIGYFEDLGHIHYRPIFHWKEWQIWEYIKKNNLPYPDLYDRGLERIGCVVCPYNSDPTGKRHERLRKLYPKFFERWESGVSELFRKRQRQEKTMYYETPRQFLDAWYLDYSARWYAKESDECDEQTIFETVAV